MNSFFVRFCVVLRVVLKVLWLCLVKCGCWVRVLVSRILYSLNVRLWELSRVLDMMILVKGDCGVVW